MCIRDSKSSTSEINQDIKTLFVGGHVAALPKETLVNEPSIDIVALNEGVYSISNLLKVDNLNEESFLKKVKQFKNPPEGDEFVVLYISDLIINVSIVSIP